MKFIFLGVFAVGLQENRWQWRCKTILPTISLFSKVKLIFKNYKVLNFTAV